MKAILNWRYYVMFILLFTGIVALLCIAGKDDRPLAEWIEVRIYLFALASACFCILAKITKRWEKKDKIPEFSNQ